MSKQVEDSLRSSEPIVSPVAGYLESPQSDLLPSDNDVEFDTETGEIESNLVFLSGKTEQLPANITGISRTW